MRRFTFNEHYFDNIDTEDKAYILGLLFADGNNHKNTISIGLQEKDKKILEIVKTKMEFTGNLYFRQSNNPKHANQFRLDLRSKILSSRLNDIGMVPKKSLILKFPTTIAVDLTHHFIRGYFDGDGSISYSEKGGLCYPNFSIVGTWDVCNNIYNIFMNLSDSIKLYIEKYGENTFKVRSGSQKNCLSIYKYMYENATIYLERKKDMFSNVRVDRVLTKKDGLHFNMKKLINTETKEVYNSRGDASSKLNVSQTTIYKWIKLNKLANYA